MRPDKQDCNKQVRFFCDKNLQTLVVSTRYSAKELDVDKCNDGLYTLLSTNCKIQILGCREDLPKFF
jgi:hypothetical protein